MLAAGPRSDPAGVQRRSVTPLTPGSALTRPAPRCLTSRVTELDVVVDPASREAPFEQVRAQVEAQIRSGRLVPGDRLPTVRALAADLGLAANTVARAFKELEAAGLVETRRRAGTVVASGEHTADVAVMALAAKFAAAARDAGLDAAAAVDLVRAALKAQTG